LYPNLNSNASLCFDTNAAFDVSLIQNNGDISIYAEQRAAIDSIDRLGLVIDVLSTLLNL
jgi:hypothetical protein